MGHVLAIQGSGGPLSVVTPLADKLLRRRDCPLSANSRHSLVGANTLYIELGGPWESG